MFKVKFTLSFLLLSLSLWLSATAVAQGTAFTYQGKLTDSGNLANGNYDLQFKLFDTATVGTGTQQGSTVTVSNVTVAGGIFTVQLDFGVCASCFNGASRFLEIAVRPTGGSFTTLTPRQPITSTPYALNAAQLGGLAASGFLQNSTSQQASSNFNISGNGTAGGTLTGSIVNAVTQVNINGLRAFTANGALNSGTDIFTASNTFAGDGAGLNTTPDPSPSGINGKLNAFFGAGAGQANTTGTQNAFFGASAGIANTTGLNNSFFGYQAGGHNTTGIFNSFFGIAAGRQNTTGMRNVFSGEEAGVFNTTGNFNSFFGASAGFSNTTGTQNTFFGSFAGQANTSGINNTFIGSSANFDATNTTGDDNTLLGAISSVNAGLSNSTAIGARAQVTASNSLVLGAINGPNGATADTKVGIGTTAPAALLDVQRDGGTIPETTRFTTFGSANEILSRLAGGTRAAPAATPNGTFLLQLGATGHDGTTFVADPGASINMDTAEAWTPTAQGTQIRFRTTPNGGTAHNDIATRMIITNDGKVGIGTSAPTNLLTIGQPEATVAAGRVGIFSPSGLNLVLRETTNDVEGIIGVNSSSGVIYGSMTNHAVLFRTNNVNRMTIAGDGGLTTGFVGIGTSTPFNRLHVAGDIRVGTSGTNGCLENNNGGTIIGMCASDARFKRDVTPFANLLSRIIQLQPVHFYWRADQFPERHFGHAQEAGLIAQEVEKVLPELVTTDEQGFKAVNYSKLPLLSLQAIKELKQENDVLKQRLNEQQKQVEALKRLVCKSNPDEEVCKP